VLALDPNQLPKDVDLLHKIVVELCERLKHETSEKDKYRSLLRELLEAQRNRKSEQLSKDQLTLFETLWKACHPEEPAPEPEAEPDAEQAVEEEPKSEEPQIKKRAATAGTASGPGAGGARSGGIEKTLPRLRQGFTPARRRDQRAV
jgi:hypothetical protein